MCFLDLCGDSSWITNQAGNAWPRAKAHGYTVWSTCFPASTTCGAEQTPFLQCEHLPLAEGRACVVVSDGLKKVVLWKASEAGKACAARFPQTEACHWDAVPLGCQTEHCCIHGISLFPVLQLRGAQQNLSGKGHPGPGRHPTVESQTRASCGHWAPWLPSFSGQFYPPGNLAQSGDMWVTWLGLFYRHLMGGYQGCCLPSCNVQDGPPSEDVAPSNVSSAQVQKRQDPLMSAAPFFLACSVVLYFEKPDLQ